MARLIYAVLLRSSDGTLSGIGAQAFADPLIEGAAVTLHGETWIVEEVRSDELPPVAVFARPEP